MQLCVYCLEPENSVSKVVTVTAIRSNIILFSRIEISSYLLITHRSSWFVGAFPHTQTKSLQLTSEVSVLLKSWDAAFRSNEKEDDNSCPGLSERQSNCVQRIHGHFQRTGGTVFHHDILEPRTPRRTPSYILEEISPEVTHGKLPGLPGLDA